MRATGCILLEKVAKPLFRMGKHEIFTSISGEMVGKNFARGVISDAHVIGNDVIELYSVACGRRNSLQEGFLRNQAGPGSVLVLYELHTVLFGHGLDAG